MNRGPGHAHARKPLWRSCQLRATMSLTATMSASATGMLETAWPLDVPTRERPAAIRLFFGCSSLVAFGGPPSGQDCRLRRRPASRRRIDAPPVEGLVVRRSSSLLGTPYGAVGSHPLGVRPE